MTGSSLSWNVNYNCLHDGYVGWLPWVGFVGNSYGCGLDILGTRFLYNLFVDLRFVLFVRPTICCEWTVSL